LGCWGILSTIGGLSQPPKVDYFYKGTKKPDIIWFLVLFLIYCERVMKRFIGTKLINALPMTRLEYNVFRGWELPADENGEDEGYLVEYLDGGKPNTTQYAGYVSWIPKEQLENAYRPTDGLNFGLAIEALKKGFKVARAGWNGKGMWLLADGLPWIGMKTADNKFVPWLASQTDMLADDWQIVA